MLEKLYARYARLIASDDIVIVIMPKHFTCCRCHKRCKSDPAQRRPVQSHLRTQTENDLGRPLEPGDVICSACRRRLARIKDLAIDMFHTLIINVEKVFDKLANDRHYSESVSVILFMNI
ncbi:hypothetical protein KUTeg_017597 [Tegillarca granosa]|uniref:Uncharacterized protein n=1 Tax=Tegillarca granosa TaxID=220873 RepID=A0ABQ9EFD3_TEGGR|nr:hypothetical protein KUTeg_017597 [Tegillarca granosa]